MEVLTGAIKESPLPLFLKLSFDQATKWKSFQDINTVTLEENVKDSINKLFSDLERMHGKYLVAHALGLITCSKHGLSDAEMDGILSTDDEVMDEITKDLLLPFRRFPTALWVKVRAQLGDYLTHNNYKGILLNTWAHHQFREAATEKYLSSECGDYQKLSSLLASYFLGDQANNNDNKSPPTTDCSAVTNVTAQPNKFYSKTNKAFYNHRKLSELSHHLIQSKDLVNLKKHVLFDFDFMFSALQSRGYHSIIGMLERSADQFPDDSECRQLLGIMRSSASVLSRFPSQLAAQLAGRIDDDAGDNNDHDDTGGSSKDEKVTGGIIDMLERINKSNLPLFVPTKPCFEYDQSVVGSSLVGHCDVINDVTVSEDGHFLYSVSNDKTLR